MTRSDSMNTQLVDSLVKIIQSLTPEERLVLDEKLHATETQSLISDGEPTLRGSTASDLLIFAGTWEGDDLSDCLQLVYDSRSTAEF